MFPLSGTFSDLIDEVTLYLQGHSVNEDQFTSLAEDLSTSALSFRVTSADAVSRGLCEIGDELVIVSSVNDDTATCEPWGRGHRGSTAVDHVAGERVNYKPVWPRSIVGRAINDIISGVYPKLFGIGSVDITPQSISQQYELPSTAERVLAVETKWSGITDWQKIHSWEMTFGHTGTGVNVTLPAIGPTGSLRLWYAHRPNRLATPEQLFTECGLPESTRDVIVLGACAKLVPWLDIGRLPVQSAESDLAAQSRAQGTALAGARDIRSLYMARLLEEQQALEAKYPPRTHRIR